MLGRLLIALILAGGLAEAASSEQPADIIRRSVVRTEANWQAAPNYSFLRTTSKSKPGHAGSNVTHQVLMIDGSPYLKIVAEDGQPLSPAMAKDEELRFQRESHRRSKESARDRVQRLRKYDEDRTRDHNLLMAISEAFDYSFADDQQSVRPGIWVLQGRPKPGYVPPNRDAKVFSGMNVKIWIDKSSYQWIRLEAEVTQPVAIYGLLAKVNPGTRFTLEQEPVSGDVWLPKHFTVQVNASALGLVHEEFTTDEMYSKYSLTGPVEIEAGLPQRAVTVQ